MRKAESENLDKQTAWKMRQERYFKRQLRVRLLKSIIRKKKKLLREEHERRSREIEEEYKELVASLSFMSSQDDISTLSDVPFVEDIAQALSGNRNSDSHSSNQSQEDPDSARFHFEGIHWVNRLTLMALDFIMRVFRCQLYN